MKLGHVIGRVTLSRALPSIQGARWLIVSPFTRDAFSQPIDAPPTVGPDPNLVVYDNLGGSTGHVIGYIEGREAAQPFDSPPPIDAINAALIDQIYYKPFPNP